MPNPPCPQVTQIPYVPLRTPMFEGQGKWLWKITRTWVVFFEKLAKQGAGTFWRTLLIKDTTVGNDIADHVPVMMPGNGIRILAVLRKAITSDLTVRINKTTNAFVILTTDSTGPIAGDTVTLGDISTPGAALQFKFVATLSNGGHTAFEVLLGATPDATLANLAAAINGGPGAGTVYGLGSHLKAIFSAGPVIAHSITITALSSTNQGSVAFTSSTHLVFSSSVFLSGNSVLATMTIPHATPVNVVLVQLIPCIQFADEQVFSADITASDGSKDVAGIASFTIQWQGLPPQ